MKLINVKFGRTTNSSSLHSIIMTTDTAFKGMMEDFKKGFPCDKDGGYGWENFVLSRPDEKLHYLMSQYSPYFDIQGIFGMHGLVYEVDHQSQWSEPLNPLGNINLEWVDAVRKLLVREDVTILGGSDNEEENPFYIPGMLFYDFNPETRIKWEGNDIFTISKPNHRGSHKRMVVDMEVGKDTPYDEKEWRPRTPHTVDLKITDYCNHFNAPCWQYCYQGSNTRGKPGVTERILEYIDELYDMEVFEIALGGGEPTTHPDLIDILKYGRGRGISMNFTTRNVEFVYSNFNECVGVGVGISVSSLNEIIDIETRLGELEESYKETIPRPWEVTRPYVNYQIVFGSIPLEELERILKHAKFYYVNILLLGWKNTGRAVKPPYDYTLKDVLIEKLRTLSLDTVLVSENWDTLIREGYDPRTMFREEGQYSMYIDGVNDYASDSSFSSIEIPLEYLGLQSVWNFLPSRKELLKNGS